MQEKIYDILNELGVPFNLSGRDYIVRAVSLIYENSRMRMCKEIYPQLSAEFEISETTVERCIRYAVDKVFEKGNIEAIKKYFGININIYTGKPTNTEFIYCIVEYLRRNK